MIDLSNIKQQQKYKFKSCCQKESTIKNDSFTIFEPIKRKSSNSTDDTDTYEECRVNEEDDDIFILKRKMKRPPEELKINFDNRKRKIEESKHSITFNEEIS